MVTVEMPFVPAQDEAIVLVQAATSGSSTPQADYILQACAQIENRNDESPVRMVNPAGAVRIYIQSLRKKSLDNSDFMPTLLRRPKHGMLTYESVLDDSVATTIRFGHGVIYRYYMYDPDPGFEGKDSARFMVEFEGKHYQIEMEINVIKGFIDTAPDCYRPKVIKVYKPSRGDAGETIIDLSSMLRFEELAGSSLAQTTGIGLNAKITLDNDAAGHGWFIDYTPYLNEKWPRSKPRPSGQGSSLRAALKGGVSNRSRFYDELDDSSIPSIQINERGEIMFFIDIPYALAQQEMIDAWIDASVQVIEVAQISNVALGKKPVVTTLCGVANSNTGGQFSAFPLSNLLRTLPRGDYPQRISLDLLNSVSEATTVVKRPRYGELRASGIEYIYRSAEGFEGEDYFTLQTMYEGQTFTLNYRVLVFGGADWSSKHDCAKPPFVDTEIPHSEPKDFDDPVSRFRSTTSLIALFRGIDDFITFADIPGTSVAQTMSTGSNAQITLDTAAAGYGRFINYTPYLNEEWLPTSNLYEWQAKPGSEAEGNMDMLSVLLHEYGHVLGLEHSGDSHDFMSTTLQPGVRRLPSAEELQQMANLVAELKGETRKNPTQNASPKSPG
jgi:predicted Zn-dependent protease